jgi:hypothetical protein
MYTYITDIFVYLYLYLYLYSYISATIMRIEYDNYYDDCYGPSRIPVLNKTLIYIFKYKSTGGSTPADLLRGMQDANFSLDQRMDDAELSLFSGMNVYKYIYIYIYRYMYIYINTCIYICTYISLDQRMDDAELSLYSGHYVYIFIHICIYTYTHPSIFMYTYIRLNNFSLDQPMDNAELSLFLGIFTYICIYKYICICI